MSLHSNEKSQVIPFGKYRGQPLKVLEKDPEYLNWLTNQDWFRTGHANLYQIVINNFAEPCDTPEHNQMQARFLDESVRLAVARLAPRENHRIISVGIPSFETEGVDVLFDVNLKSPADCEPCKVCGGVLFWSPTNKSEIKCEKCNPKEYGNFYSYRADGWPVVQNLKIEIKPDVGDDFPSVMRQMRRSKSTVLFLRNYTGTGIDRPKFVEMFNSQKMIVVFESEIDGSCPNCPIFVP